MQALKTRSSVLLNQSSQSTRKKRKEPRGVHGRQVSQGLEVTTRNSELILKARGATEGFETREMEAVSFEF